MFKKNPPDYVFLVLAGALVVFGFAMLDSASGPYAYEKFKDSFYFIKHQFINGLAPGILLFLFFANFNYRRFKKWAVWMYFFSIILLLLVFIPGIGASFGHAKSWVDFRIFSFQPAEIVKLAMLFYFAAWFERRGGAMRDLKMGLLSFTAVLSPILVLVMLQPDIGTMLGIAVTAASLYFIAGAPVKHILGLLAAGLAGIFALIKIAPYRLARLTAFLHPEKDPLNIGYHINQALLAIGSGGLLGLGFNHSRQKYQYLPEVVGDSIFAVMAEELGFFFTIAFLCLFVAFLFRIFKIAKESTDGYGRLLALGVVSWFGLQMFINIGSMLGLMPMTGLTLPFVSYGGTSLAISMAAVGVVANISRHD